MIYKICSRALWDETLLAGRFPGAPVDIKDGYIHFSTAAQVRETARLHFSGADDLMLLALDPDGLGDALVFEASRGGALFPHLYGSFTPDDVAWHAPLPRGADGAFVFPAMVPQA